MKFDLNSVKRNMRWHVPCSIATLAMGIYLALVYLVPSFAQEYHAQLFHSDLNRIVPYAIVMLVGSPLFSLWFYTKIGTDEDFRNWYFE
jgi:hypothetical protein